MALTAKEMEAGEASSLIPPLATTRRSRLPEGWKGGMARFAIAVSVVLLSNIILLIWMGARHGISTDINHFYEGPCTKVRYASIAIHLLINIFSTTLLGASNYCMQCITAPSRQDLDKAHARKASLDIGIHSPKNLRWMKFHRKLLWTVLGLSSVPLHLFFNSVVFTSIAANDYLVLAVTEEFINPGPIDISNLNIAPLNTSQTNSYIQTGAFPLSVNQSTGLYELGTGPFINVQQLIIDLHINASRGRLHRLELKDCINTYAQPFLEYNSNVILVNTNQTVESGPAVYRVEEVVNEATDNDINAITYGWVCEDPPINGEYAHAACETQIQSFLSGISDWQPLGWNVDYCLSQTTQQRCKLNYSMTFLAVVVACNICKLLGMVVIITFYPKSRLIVLGDAIASFIALSDSTTKGRCLYSKADFDKKDLIYGSTGKHYTNSRVRRGRMSSNREWTIYLVIWVLGILGSILSLYMGLLFSSTPITAIESLGLGSLQTQTFIDWSLPHSGTAALLDTILIVNAPQIILSLYYFYYNSVMTRMLAGREWARYATRKKSLRVSSDPQGLQRTMYRLQIPYKFAIPTFILSPLLHWLLSQSIYLVYVERYAPDGRQEPLKLPNCVSKAWCETGSSYISAGWSPIGIVAFLVVSTVWTCYLLGLSFCRYPAGMPLGCSSSQVVSAACHVLNESNDVLDFAQRELQWGVVSGEQHGDITIGHCAFSSEKTELPVMGQLYA